MHTCGHLAQECPIEIEACQLDNLTILQATLWARKAGVQALKSIIEMALRENGLALNMLPAATQSKFALSGDVGEDELLEKLVQSAEQKAPTPHDNTLPMLHVSCMQDTDQPSPMQSPTPSPVASPVWSQVWSMLVLSQCPNAKLLRPKQCQAALTRSRLPRPWDWVVTHR